MALGSTLFFLFTTLFSVSLCDYSLTAGGATFPADVYSDWIFAFELKSETTTITYDRVGSGAGKAGISKNTSDAYDFAGTDAPFKPADYEAHPELDLQLFPFVAGSIVFVYNLPDINKLRPTNSTLIFSREVAVGIFNGTITSWDHPLIVDEQDPIWKPYFDAFKLDTKTQPISVYVRKDKSGTTDIFTSALSSFSTDTYGPSELWEKGPKAYPSLLNGTTASFTTADQNFGVMAEVAANPYSIGYVSLSQPLQNGYQHIGRMKNKEGFVVEATEKFVQSAIGYAEFDQYFTAHLVDLPGAESYPIIGFSYIAIQKAQQPWMDCARRKEAWKFFNYILTDEKTASRAAGNGFSPVGPALAEKVLALLETVECDGISLLAYETPTSHGDDFIVPISVIAGVLGMFSLLSLVWFIVQLFRGGKLPVPLLIFGIITCVAGILGYIGIGMWVFVPTEDPICMARVWLCSIGITLLLASSISRASQIQTYAQVMKSRSSVLELKDLASQKLWITFLDVFVMVIIQVVICIIWQTVDPYRSTIVVLDDFHLTAEYHCQSDSLGLWGVEAGYIAVIVIYGVIQIYRSWSIASKINQSKWILLSLYNVMLTGAACLPIIALVEGEKNLATVAVSGLLFIFFQIQASFLVPSVIYQAAVSAATSASRASGRSRRHSSDGSGKSSSSKKSSSRR